MKRDYSMHRKVYSKSISAHIKIVQNACCLEIFAQRKFPGSRRSKKVPCHEQKPVNQKTPFFSKKTPETMHPYFDFHFHPSLKSFLSDERPGSRDDCWVVYNNAVNIIRSQGSLQQSWDGRVRLGVAALYVLERPFTSSFLIEHIAPILTPLDNDMLRLPQETDNLERFRTEINHLRASAEKYAGQGKRMQIIRSIDEYDPEKINLVLAIEGSHCFDLFNSLLQNNLRKLKESGERFLYLNLTHLARFPTCSHAYGIKLIRGHDQFRPIGKGITALGKEIIDIAYDRNIGNHRILIDIKHMSLESRKQFYAYRKEKGYEDIPIVASHMGCTGISMKPEVIRQYMEKQVPGFDTVEVRYKKPRGIGGPFRIKTEFNPWSINLYNEEIPIILNSGGLIGVNLDKRILGAKRVDGEFFSHEEFSEAFGLPVARSLDAAAAEDRFWEESRKESDPDERDNAVRHLRHLCNQILHIVEIGGAKAWKQMCIGTDFDGLIDPVNICLNHHELPSLEESLASMLQQMIREAKRAKPGLDYQEGNIQARVRDIMFNNGVRFLQKHFA